MKKQNSQNKILGKGKPNLQSKFGVKEFYFGCFVFFLAIYLILLPAALDAQFNLPAIGIKPAIIVNSDPITPLPNSTVTVTANITGLVGGGNPSYTWFLNGARQSVSGLNKNILIFKVGDIGTIYRISVNAKTPSGELSDAINLTTSDIDLTWAANSEAPAAYHAKIMPTQNSVVTISALPFIYRPGTKSQISSSNLMYNWIISGKLDSMNSGIDKNTYILSTNNFFGNNYIVRLEVKTSDGAVSLNKFIEIPVVRPQIWLYFSDPKTNQLVGTALKNLATTPTNLNFIAEPYFFTVPKKYLKWRWLINNKEVSGENEKPWLATLNLTDNFLRQFFSIQIQATAENPNNNFEIGGSTINLEMR